QYRIAGYSGIAGTGSILNIAVGGRRTQDRRIKMTICVMRLVAAWVAPTRILIRIALIPGRGGRQVAPHTQQINRRRRCPQGEPGPAIAVIVLAIYGERR